MSIVKVDNLNVSLGKKKILKNINFEINEGEVVGLLGPNGAGKTTLMKSMCGLVKVSGGDIIIDGYSVKSNLQSILEKMGVLIEDTCAYQNLSGYDNLKILARMNKEISEDDLMKIVDIVNLSDAIHDKFKTYSLGMRKRLGIAMALIKKPNILILDEPTNGLDVEGIYEIKRLIKKLVEEKRITVFISSHLTEQLSEMCNRVVFIKKGVLIQQSSIVDLNGEKLEQYYLKVMEGRDA